MRIFVTILAFAFVIFASQNVEARQERIAVVVNDDAISMSDVNDRLQLVLVSSGLPNTKEIREKLVQQVIGSLIDEQIKMQEARRLEVEVASDEIDRGFVAIAQQNKFEPQKFMAALKKSGINLETMRRQIEAQVAWSKIVQQEIRPQISITDNDVEAVLRRFENNKGMTEYFVSEIFLPVDDPKNESDTRQLAQRLAREIKGGKAPFFKIAQQFSKAAGAPQGGDIGWVQQTQLPEELSNALQTMKKSEISQPIRSLNGYHVLLLKDSRLVSDETVPNRDQITANIGLERLERLQRRYLLDLKASAFIENRVGS